jgi:hypothetical protein
LQHGVLNPADTVFANQIEEVDDFDLTPNDCLFCAHSSSNVEENLKHMSSKHR